ncbi:MAG TPA: ubiquinone/menaquinone biosynthesis methyltransferase [Methylomirabilota bacterium]|nr:ubiquinone/menaquinone biosynthesis methyltransferase [Methylomirabilota bacterium]
MTPPRAGYVRAMFTRIARRYDLMNTLMTAGRHHAWRDTVARLVAASPPGPVLDLATGTGDLAVAIREAAPERPVVGVDFSEGMLGQARLKLQARRVRGIALVNADALALPFAGGTFACVTSAFLLRNLEDLPRGLAEMRRVTRAGGRVITLDIVRPAMPLWGAVFGLYFGRVVPAVGALVAGDRAAYAYLPQSVNRFVSPQELARLMRAAGLREVTWRTLALGTVALHLGVA